MLDAEEILQAGEPPGEDSGMRSRLRWAQRILSLGMTVTRAEFKERVHQLLQAWHPDHATATDPRSLELTQRILIARDIIDDYLVNYRYSLQDAEIDKYLSPREWFEKRFGDDP
ncbi:MAG: J domain-containing protein [Magnetococcales bacterium]|nr:J domain-containing protein [Magnetococcales bacterium]